MYKIQKHISFPVCPSSPVFFSFACTSVRGVVWMIGLRIMTLAVYWALKNNDLSTDVGMVLSVYLESVCAFVKLPHFLLPRQEAGVF